METEPWWKPTQSKSLTGKIGPSVRIRKNRITDFLSIPLLHRALLRMENNTIFDYWQFYGYFEEDEERYYATFRNWDLSVSWSDFKEVGTEHILELEGRSWKFTRTEPNLVECVLLSA